MLRNLSIKRLIVMGMVSAFLGSFLSPSYAQELTLPAPGTMVNLSSTYVPVLIKGLRVHPDNPLLFDFILDTGKSGFQINSSEFKSESQKLIKYFLASLTIKEDDLWVNLSPYEKNRIIPNPLGQTELGRDMLAQDYILKQLTASLIYPEKQLGKEFWNTVYAKAQQEFGTSDIPVDTFNKVWIVADKAKILERNNVGYVVGTHLKVMLEEDYLALKNHTGINQASKTHTVASQVVREIIIPALEREVNQGRNFAPLRQMFYSMILASWYKLALKDALLNQVYSNKGKTGGVLSDDPTAREKIFQQYLQAYKKGVFNYIKEDVDAVSKQSMPRKYFSGGVFGKVHLTRESFPISGDDTDADGAMAVVETNMSKNPDAAMLEVAPEDARPLMALVTYLGRMVQLVNEVHPNAGIGMTPISTQLMTVPDIRNGALVRKYLEPISSAGASKTYRLGVSDQLHQYVSLHIDGDDLVITARVNNHIYPTRYPSLIMKTYYPVIDMVFQAIRAYEAQPQPTRIKFTRVENSSVQHQAEKKDASPEEIFADTTPDGLRSLREFIAKRVYSVKAVRGVVMTEGVVREMIAQANRTPNEMMFHLTYERGQQWYPLDTKTGLVTYNHISTSHEGGGISVRGAGRGHPAHTHPFGNIQNNCRLMSGLDAEMISSSLYRTTRDLVGVIMGGSANNWGLSAWIWSENKENETSNLSDPGFKSLPITVVNDRGEPLSANDLRRLGILATVNPNPYLNASEKPEDVTDIDALRRWLGQLDSYLRSLTARPQASVGIKIKVVGEDKETLIPRGMELWRNSRFNKSEQGDEAMISVQKLFAQHKFTPGPDRELAHLVQQGIQIVGEDNMVTYIKKARRFNKQPVHMAYSRPGEFLIAGTERVVYWYDLRKSLELFPKYFSLAKSLGLPPQESMDLLFSLVDAIKYDFTHVTEEMEPLIRIMEASSARGFDFKSSLSELKGLLELSKQDGEMGRALGITALAINAGISVPQSIELVTDIYNKSAIAGYAFMALYDELNSLRTVNVSGDKLFQVLKLMGGDDPYYNQGNYSALTQLLYLAATHTQYSQDEIFTRILQTAERRKLVTGQKALPAVSKAEEANEDHDLFSEVSKELVPVRLQSEMPVVSIKEPNAYFPEVASKQLVHGVLPYRLHRNLSEGLNDLKTLMEQEYAEGAWIYDNETQMWYSLGGRTYVQPGRVRQEFLPYDVSKLSNNPVFLHIHPKKTETFVVPHRDSLALPQYQKKITKFFAAMPSRADFLTCMELLKGSSKGVPLNALIVTSVGVTQVRFPNNVKALESLGEVFQNLQDKVLLGFNIHAYSRQYGLRESDFEFVNRLTTILNDAKLPRGFEIILHPYNGEGSGHSRPQLPGGDLAQLVKQAPGGIDFNAQNMAMDVAREGKGIEINFDPAMVAEFRRGDFSGIVANIIRIVPIKSALPIMGLEVNPT